MEKKHTLILDKEFTQYCELNKIINVDKLAQETFNRGFSLLKYGEVPNGNRVKEIIEVEVEKIVEVIKEVPIEIKGDTQVVIKEVIKEIIVEKLIDDYECKNMLITLTEANLKLKEELETITNALNKFNKGTRMKNSDLGSLYDE